MNRDRACFPGKPRAIALRIASALFVVIVAVAAEHVYAATPAEAESKGTSTFAVPRHVVAGGGGSSSGGAFAIQGTIGQLDADPLQPSTGGNFDVIGGFWPGLAPAIAQPEVLFTNGFE